jgi:phosphosulfolactate phosphohydrolase-like enzyme
LTGKKRILAASNPEECGDWSGAAVVVDVLRCSTNICAMLVRGKPFVRIYADKDAAVAWHDANPGSEFFSELDYPEGFVKYDNSPWQALHSDPAKPAVLVTGAGTRAMLSLKKASSLHVGCFANFPWIAEKVAAMTEDVLIVPAGLFYLNHAEDRLCAGAIKAAALGCHDCAQAALAEFKKTGRPEEFLSIRGEAEASVKYTAPNGETGNAHAQKDLELAATIGSLKALPVITLEGDHAIARNELVQESI